MRFLEIQNFHMNKLLHKSFLLNTLLKIFHLKKLKLFSINNYHILH